MCVLFCQIATAQDSNTSLVKGLNFPSSFIDEVQSKYSHLEERLTKQTEKYLKRLSKRENKLKRKLSKIDSATSQKLFGNVEEEYDKIAAKLNTSDSNQLKGSKGVFVQLVDSVKTSLAFLQQNSSLLSETKGVPDKIRGSLSQVNQLQSKLLQSEAIKAFICNRKQQIKGGLSKYPNLPKGINNCFSDFKKDAYYYNQQVKEYRDMLKEPDRMVEKGLTLLSKLPAFQQFMQQHSELVGLFRLPDNYGTPQSLAGLQTRAQVQQQIQTQLASAGPNAQQYLQQNLQAAQSQLNQLKDKVNKLGGSSDSYQDDMDMPDFKPNEQKTKTFWQRLEYGSNFQTAKSNFFPTTTDFGLSVGYKINDKSTIGVGASYKMGWGEDIRHISITHEGMGLRSYLDMKLKGSFYASGGFEYNYQPLTLEGSNSSSILPTTEGKPSSWTQSGLLGLSKIISIQSKFFKKTKIQLLWDFLSYQQVPQSQPVKFRVAYNF